MLRILNANCVGEIEEYSKSNQYSMFGFKKVNHMIKNEKAKFRFLIFNQFILPIADIENDRIDKLIIYDTRFLSKESRNIVVFAGSIDREFVEESIILVNSLHKKTTIKKVTIKGDIEIFGNCITEINGAGFKKELDVTIGITEYLQYSLFLV